MGYRNGGVRIRYGGLGNDKIGNQLGFWHRHHLRKITVGGITKLISIVPCGRAAVIK